MTVIVRPIIFSPAMVVALLKDEKRQTRRLALDKRGRPSIWCRVAIGDLLYVRERWQIVPFDARAEICCYFAGAGDGYDIVRPDLSIERITINRWRSPLHLPRTHSRLTLEVVRVRIEPLRRISNIDARAEGVDCWPDYVEGRRDPFPAERFKSLWATLHGVESWDANPDVVAITFRVHQKNVDAYLAERKAA